MSVRQHDVVLIGVIHKRRRRICDLLNKYNITAECLTNYFLNDFEDSMKTTKIVINVHYFPNVALETHRLSQALIWKVPIISEPSKDIFLDKLWADEAGVIFQRMLPSTHWKTRITEYELVYVVKKLLQNSTKREQLGEKGRKFIIKSVQNNHNVCTAMNKICDDINKNQ